MELNSSMGSGRNWMSDSCNGNTTPHVSGQRVQTDMARPLEIKSTADALNLMSEHEGDDWLVHRTSDQLQNVQHVENYESEPNRLASFFGHWPEDAAVSAEELAGAGLYYVGPDDRVQCACCRGRMYNWARGDTAIGEHIRHFPNCHFIQNKMTQLVNLPKRTASSTKSKSSHANIYESTVKIVTNMGYPQELVQLAMEKLTMSEAKVSVDKLLDIVYELEEAQSDMQLPSAMESENIDNLSEDDEDKPEASDSVESTATKKLELQSTSQNNLQEEKRMPMDKIMCKVCMDAELNMLFLPCRHLVCCEACGSMLSNCPVCRTPILGTVNTFLV